MAVLRSDLKCSRTNPPEADSAFKSNHALPSEKTWGFLFGKIIPSENPKVIEFEYRALIKAHLKAVSNP